MLDVDCEEISDSLPFLRAAFLLDQPQKHDLQQFLYNGYQDTVQYAEDAKTNRFPEYRVNAKEAYMFSNIPPRSPQRNKWEKSGY